MAVAFGLAGLVACSPVSRGSLETIKMAVHGGNKPDVTPEAVAAKPYFQLEVKAPTGTAVLILAKVDHGQLGWYGGNHDIVITRGGLVIKTVGLRSNLDAMAIQGDDPFRVGLHRLQGPVDYTRRMDWSPDYRYGVEVQAHLEPQGVERVSILGHNRELRRVDERLTVLATGEHMTNRYWVDPADGFIWKSRQYVAPGFPLELIQLRPYRGADS